MKRYKYPRIPHLPWSNASTDDKKLKDISHLEGKEIVVTVKMDGENTTMYKDHLHARSLDSKDHPSRSWVKQYHGRIKHTIENDYRICGENLFAKHSIHYQNLSSYFMCFNVWNKEECLDWDSTLKYAEERNIPMVPVLYRGPCYKIILDCLEIENFDKDLCEGYVIRLAGSFNYDEVMQSMAKYVRENHIQTEEHWMYTKVIKNKLSSAA